MPLLRGSNPDALVSKSYDAVRLGVLELYRKFNNICVHSFVLTGAPLVNKSANPDPGCFAALEVSAAALDQIAGAAPLDGLIARFAC